VSASLRSSSRVVRPDVHWRPPVVRALVAVAVEVTLYYTLPLERGLSVWTVAWLVLGLAVFALVLARQVAQIVGSPHPRLRAIVAIMVSLPVFLLVFSTTYYLIENASSGAFSESLSRTDALYFTVTVFATVGFGDITPTEAPTRVLVMFQMLGDLVLVGLIGRVVVGAVSVGLQRRPAAPDGNEVSVSSRPDDEGWPSEPQPGG
jgi:voltage-gated potassium channel